MTSAKHVVVAGAGVVGLACAYYLRSAGADVTVLERTAVGSGASSGNTGWISPTFAAPLAAPGVGATALRALARRNGAFYIAPSYLPKLAPWLWSFWRASTPDRYETGLRALASFASPTSDLYRALAADGIDLEASGTDGVLHVFRDARDARAALKDLRPFEELGYEVPADIIDDSESLRRIEPSLGSAAVAGFVVRGEYAIHSASLLTALHRRLAELRVPVIEGAGVTGFATQNGSVRAAVTEAGRHEADAFVLAPGVWLRDVAALLGVRIPVEAGKGYSFSIALETPPTHCVHLSEEKIAVSPLANRVRLAGTMEFSGRTSTLNERRITAIAKAARPYLADWDGNVSEPWAGMRPVTSDSLPVIGKAGAFNNLYMAGGHGMLGVTLALATGTRITEALVSDRPLDDLRLFRPDRFNR